MTDIEKRPIQPAVDLDADPAVDHGEDRHEQRLSSHPILVGVDGSPSADVALEVAITQARLRHRRLLLVTAWLPLPTMYAPLAVDTESAHGWGREVLDANLAKARAEAPELVIDGLLVGGPPAQMLVQQSQQASMVVVGRRGRGGFSSLLLGSTSDAVARHSHVPVIVARSETAVGLEAAAPVIVGIDGSESSTGAIEFAFESASMMGAPLVAVHAWTSHDVFADAIDEHSESGVARGQVEAHLILSEALAGWREKYPEVTVKELALREHPVQALTSLGKHAQLVVVGSRGRGGFAGVLLGSVGHGVLHHCTGQVAVVHPN